MRQWSSVSSRGDDEEEMPSLTNSDTSRGSPQSDHYDEEHRSNYSSSSDDVVRRRNTDLGADGPSRGRRARSRSRPRTRDGEDDEIVRRRHTDATGERSRRRSRSRARSKSRPRSKSKSKQPPSSSRLRFSYARRLSLGGGTVYRTPHMATLDSHLRSTSGLRLQTDGTCNFLFERQRFVIETTEETGDFLFYASFGPLEELQRRNKPRNLLRLLAHMNEEIKRRNGQIEDEGLETSGLLRIDSSKAEGPRVAFIYYGHVDEVIDSQHFQETLDDFVDDALDFSEKLHGLKEEDADQREVAPALADARSQRSFRSDDSSEGRPRVTREHARSQRSFRSDDSSEGRSRASREKQPVQKEAATPAATATTNNNTTENSGKKSVFTKMISTLRNKSNDIGSLAFVDPSNPTCAFVVDKEAAEEGNIRATIVLSRKGEERKDPSNGVNNAKKGGSFHGRADDLTQQRDRYPRKGRSFHTGDESSSSRRPRKSTSFVDDGPAQPSSGRRGSSFVEDGGRRQSSFHLDDSGRHRRKGKGRSFHRDDGRGGSFHATERSKRGSYLDEDSTDYERSNKSIDIYDGSNQACSVRVIVPRLHQSEPVVSPGRDYPEAPPARGHHSRRHSSIAASGRRSKNSNGHHTRRRSKSRSRRSSNGAREWAPPPPPY